MNLTFDQYIAIASLLVAVVSGFIAFRQTLKVKRIDNRNKEQLLLFLDRIRYLGFEHEYVDKIAEQLDNMVDVRYLSSWHQSGCELYMEMVEYYLSLQDDFTFDDLRKMCNSTIVSYEWQEKYWRTLVQFRPENKSKELPKELFLEKKKTDRLEYREKSETENKSKKDTKKK